MKLNKLTVSIFTFTLVFITGCLEVSVNQPTQVTAGQTVSASVQVVLSADPEIGSGDDRRMMFAVNKPTGWVIDSITYSSPEYGAGQFNYLGDAVESDDRPGGQTRNGKVRLRQSILLFLVWGGPCMKAT